MSYVVKAKPKVAEDLRNIKNYHIEQNGLEAAENVLHCGKYNFDHLILTPCTNSELPDKSPYISVHLYYIVYRCVRTLKSFLIKI